ncbi:MAG TPA: PEGA domain-containing protein [Patescibacteria group bacterium]
MTLRNRFTLVGLGMVIFLIITPALILYARGFQIDWQNWGLVKTGAMVVRTQPTKAEIFLNDKKHKSTTPANLRFLLPGDYNIRLEKEKYQSWTKRLSVKSQLVTWANFNRDYLTLFLTKPDQTQNLQIKASTISKTGNEIIFLSPDRLGRINVNNGSDLTLINTNNLNLPILSSTVEIVWNNAQEVFNLFADKSTLNTLESQLPKIQHLETEGSHGVALIASDLYFIQANGLALLDKTVSNFTLSNDGIWYIQKNTVKHYDFSNNKSEVIFTQLPASTQNKVIRTSNQIYLILDGTLYLFNGALEKIYSPVTQTFWDENSGQLLYSNEHEIYSYQPNTKDSTLILRSLTPISSPVLNKETGYVFYQNEGKIKAIELDGRDHRNIFTIADALNNFSLSKDGKKLYTISRTEIKIYQIR